LYNQHKVLRLYGGAGATLQFATPVITAQLIEDALGEAMNITRNVGPNTEPGTMSADLFGNTDLMKGVIDEIISNLMIPHWGMHIGLGAMVKVPVVPLGIYVDGKFMIPFGDIDETAGLKGLGMLINAGILLAF